MSREEFTILMDIDDTISSNSELTYNLGGNVSGVIDGGREQLPPLKEGALELGDFLNNNPHLKLVFWTSCGVQEQLAFGKALGVGKFFIAGNSREDSFQCVRAEDFARFNSQFTSVNPPKFRSLLKLFPEPQSANFLWVEDSLNRTGDKDFFEEQKLNHRHLGVGSMEPIAGSVEKWKGLVEGEGTDWRQYSGMFPFEEALLPRLKRRLLDLGVSIDG